MVMRQKLLKHPRPLALVMWIALVWAILACNLTTVQQVPTAQPTPVPLVLPTTPPLAPDLLSVTSSSNPLTTSTCALTPPTWVAYTVQPGDSLGALSVAVDTPLQELVTNNCLENADQLFADQIIYLPRLP